MADMTLAQAMEVADMSNVGLLLWIEGRDEYENIHQARDVALGVCAAEIRRRDMIPCYCYGHDNGCQQPYGGKCSCEGQKREGE